MDDSRHGDFVSSDWLEPRPELRLVDGVWKQVVKWVPPSSSRHAGKRKPRSMREKLEWEAAEKAEEEARKAAEPEAEQAAAAASPEPDAEAATETDAPEGSADGKAD